jgi:hypothetical protein
MPVEIDEGDLIFSFDNPVALVRFDDDTDMRPSSETGS